MPKKIIVIGANHAGTAALNTILDNYKDVDVTAFDANSNISFLGCGMALWIGGQISGPDGLFYSSKEILEGKGAKIYMETSVNSVDFDNKVVYTKDAAGKDCEYPYNKLILATGSTPVGPQLPGMSLDNVQFVKLYQNAAEVIEKLGDTSIKKVAVVGAGYIGVELAEAFQRNGREVTLIDCADTCLSAYYDDIFCKRMEKQLSDHGIRLAFGEKVKQLEGNGKVDKVVTDQNTYDADMVIFCVGFRPNTKLGNGQLKQFHNNGAYLTDLMQQTSRPDVYAVGDCATVYNNAIEDTDYIALATNAVRSGIIAAHNACGTELKSPGVQGSNGISIWGLNMVSTGLSLERTKKLGFDAAATDYEDWQKAGFMEKDNYKVVIRIVYDKKTRRILGAQLCSDYDISMAIHLFSMAIQEKVTIDKLKLFDLFFLPHFNQPYNYITMAALNAE
nr:FAD-dependent oxidoreductase [uncultured Anaerostipes sp.]